MKRGKGESPHRGWRRFAHLLLVAVLLCVLSLFLEMPKLFKSSLVPYASSTEDITKESVESVDRSNLKKGEYFVAQNSFINEDAGRSSVGSSFGTSFQGVTRTHLVAEVNGGADDSRQGLFKQRFEPGLGGKRPYTVNVAQELKPYGSNTNRFRGVNDSTRELSGLQRLAEEAWILGAKVWQALKNSTVSTNDSNLYSKKVEACTKSVFKSGDKLRKARNVMVLPCGLMLGSSITVVGQPRTAHIEHTRRMSRMKKNYSTILVSQFSVELLGLKVVDGEDPPRIMHFNPRLKGDWSGYPVIEVNTNYRGQWGAAQRCIGWESTSDDEDTVDELLKCEKWIRDDENLSKESKTTWWLDRLMGHSEISKMNWQYPFVEGQTFVLTIRAGWEGYHMSIDGRHVTSFPYRTGFVMEEATGLSVKGDVDLHSVVATSLPSSHPRFSPENLLERFDRWKAPPLPEGGIELFIGVSSASYHFAERVAVRKTWMQSNLITSSKVVARFFVALHASKEVNLQLMKEASYYNDVVILPFMDHYELLVLKTVSICEYGVHHFSAKYIMKCDDDTFIRVETVLDDVKATRYEHGLYMGNINLYHKPLRLGKWAVTYEEWPEEDYPPYANGAGYVITSDIADFIVSQHANHTLRLFKMEDVSMGMWVVQFNTSHNVYYQHNWKFCQFGCIEEYLTAHYQSPRQMLCMWEKLSKGKVQCCNFK